MNDRSDAARHAPLLAPAVVASVPVPLAARIMRRRALESLVVLEDGGVCGVLTEADLVRTAALGRRWASHLNVGDVCRRSLVELMTPDPLVVMADATVADAATSMLERGVPVAVTVAGSAVTGVVTGRDVAAATADGSDPAEMGVEAVGVDVGVLALHDGLDRAVTLAGVGQGRPVPVVDGERPVGTVEISLRPAGAAPVALPPAPGVMTRPRDGSRFYSARRPPSAGFPG